jgi:MtN3 and saliva related transmembrane protein
MILSYLAGFFGFFIGVANFPQAIKIFKTKSAKDISIITLSIFFMGSFVWTLYGIELQNVPIIITNGLAFISLCFVLIGWILYGKD